METVDDKIIDAFGGTTAVSRLTAAPISTVHSWRKNGIPLSRRAHLILLAERDGRRIDWSTGVLHSSDGDTADHADSDSAPSSAASPDKAADRIGGEPKQVAA